MRLFGCGVAVGILVTLVCGVVLAALAASEAEHKLHAVILTADLIEEFIDENDRWPRDWQELEAMQLSRRSLFSLPEDFQEVNKRVGLRFDVDPITEPVDPYDLMEVAKPYFGYAHRIEGVREALARVRTRKAETLDWDVPPPQAPAASK